MKKVLCFGLVFAFVCFSASILFAEEYNWDEAAKHIGEKATVCGEIVDSLPYMGMTILGMGAAVMESSAVGIEVDDSIKGDLDKDLYVGKTICVTGEIHENPNGGGSINVSDASQIKVK